MVTQWLLESGAAINALDRFNRTPLEDAVRGEFLEVARLLIDRGGMIFQRGKLVSVADSELSGYLNLQALGLTPGFEGLDLDPEWEIDPTELKVLDKLGQGEFGTVFKAKWRGSYVAVKASGGGGGGWGGYGGDWLGQSGGVGGGAGGVVCQHYLMH